MTVNRIDSITSQVAKHLKIDENCPFIIRYIGGLVYAEARFSPSSKVSCRYKYDESTELITPVSYKYNKGFCLSFIKLYYLRETQANIASVLGVSQSYVSIQVRKLKKR